MKTKTKKKARDPKMLGALRKSVKHWERLASGTHEPGEGPYGESCALCKLYLGDGRECDGCPVKSITGKPLCQGTPWRSAAIRWESSDSDAHERFRFAAIVELNFLKAVLKANE